MSSSPLHIRPATTAVEDHELLVDFHDSQISWLSTIGSGDQWGRESIRKSRPNAPERTLAWVQKSETGQGWGPEWCRAWIAEVTSTDAPATGEMDSQEKQSGPAVVPVAGLVLDAKSAAYVRSILPEQDESEPFVYLSYLMSNRAAGEHRKGAGSALIAFAKARAQELGVHRICLDCWRGNDRKLVRYYEQQGFVLLGDFTTSEKDWPGSVMEMRV